MHKLSLLLFAMMAIAACNNPSGNAEASGQQPQTAPANTASAYGGIYSFGDDDEKSAAGSLSLFPESDSTLLFYLEVNRGAPSYNMGLLYGRMILHDDAGVYFYKQDYQKQGCKLQFSFQGDAVSVSTASGFDECEFGNGVVADNTYRQESAVAPEFFISAEGDTVRFATTSPEKFGM